MELSKAQEIVDKFNIKNPTIVGYGPSGSRMYGLHKDHSDYDWFVVVEKLGIKNEIHHQYGEDDVWVTDSEKFVTNISKSSPNYVDFLFSPETQWVQSSPLYPYTVGTPVDFSKYADKIGQHIKSDIHTLAEKESLWRDRDRKMLKTAVRNSFQKYRAEQTVIGNPFRVKYSATERDNLLGVYSGLLNVYEHGNIYPEGVIRYLENRAASILG